MDMTLTLLVLAAIVVFVVVLTPLGKHEEERAAEVGPEQAAKENGFPVALVFVVVLIVAGVVATHL
jgi:hypothetical protein